MHPPHPPVWIDGPASNCYGFTTRRTAGNTMQDYPNHDLSFVGLQRTGTNYVRQVLRTALPNLTIRNGFWKHAFQEETDSTSVGRDVIIVSRHPVLWLQSCLINSAKDIKESRPEYFPKNGDQVIGYANVYNRFYGGWLQHKREFGAYLLRYEDVLSGDLRKLSSAFGGRFKPGDYIREIPRLPQSVELSEDDIQAVLNRNCSLAPDVVKRFWSQIELDHQQRTVIYFRGNQLFKLHSGRATVSLRGLQVGR